MSLHGALDTKTSVQVMEILKKISKDKLIIMVTHNPELAENYSSRIIKILDGVITEDSNPITETEEQPKIETNKIGKTSMSFWTAFRLSLNNLLTKKGRTILVAFAGSIGIIGIALVLSVSNGFQSYVDKIQEDTLTSYPLTIMQESTDLASALLSMTSGEEKTQDSDNLKEEQYISKMLESLSTNDLKSFKNHLEENYDDVKDDLSAVTYGYSVQPSIYTIDASDKLAQLNPSNLFSSSFGSTMGMQYGSTFSQMMDDKETIDNSYDILAGHLPQNYNEMVVVLSERNSISDFLLYSLGIRPTEELTDIVTKIMSGEKVDLNNEPMTISYEDLMNTELKLIMPADKYRYNEQYNIYEDMTEDEEYLKNLYENATQLKIVGILAAKEGVTTLALNPGVLYTSDLIDYIIDYSADTDIVKRQLENDEVDVLSNTRFDASENNLDLNFEDLVSVDSAKLSSAFNVNIDQNRLQKETEGYMGEIANSISTDTTPAYVDLTNNFNILANGMFNSITGEVSVNDVDNVVDSYLEGYEPSEIFKSLETKYIVPKDTFKTMYAGLLKGLLQVYINSAYAANSLITGGTEDINSSLPQNIQDSENTGDIPEPEDINPKAVIDQEMVEKVTSSYIASAAIEQTFDTMAKAMTEAVMKVNVLTKVGELTSNLTNSFASAFNVDQDKIASSFQLKLTEEEITRIVTAMVSKTEVNAKTNLINLGYQEKEEPTYISFYFKTFEGKEHFIDFIKKYNDNVKEKGEDDKEINYTDTTGILMDSVKTIVNAVTYVLIAFISISLVVSSIMIGIITYISVYERTKEIGILRAIGASKHNISSIFNAETFIIGLLSGLFGIGVTYALIPIINTILHHFTGNIPLNASFYFSNAIILVILSVILTLIGGLIPAKAASKKDPVIALRTE